MGSEYSTITSLCSDFIGARGHVSNIDAPVSVWWLLAHLSPLGWEHINLTGDYIWVAVDNSSENYDELRPLRTSPKAVRKAA